MAAGELGSNGLKNESIKPLIDVRDLSKSFGRLEAVHHLSLQVTPGEIYGLVGPDGAGKTTTVRLLCGALQPTAGEVFVGGYSMTKQPEQARAQLGYLPQRFSQYEELTVLENLRFLAEVRGLGHERWLPRSQEILHFVGLSEFSDRRAGRLSGGMKQKLGLAAALVHEPRILLLDEPTTGVDPVTRQDFWQLIIRLSAQEGVAVLVTTPYMDEATRCTRLGFIRQGRLQIEGTPMQIRARLDGRVVLLQGSPLPLLRDYAKDHEDVEDALLFGNRIHLRIRRVATHKVISRLERYLAKSGGTVTQLRLISPQLEDVFIALLAPENEKTSSMSSG